MPFSRKNIAAFCCLNALTAALLTVVCFSVCGIDADVWGLLFSLTADCGHFAIAGLLLFIPLTLARLCGSAAAKIAAVFLGSLTLSVLALDIFVFVYYRTHLNPALLGLFLSPAGKELVPLNLAMLLVIASVPAGFVILEMFYVKLSSRLRFKAVACFIVFSLLCVPACNLIFIFAKFHNYIPVLTRVEAVPYLQVLSANKMLKKLGFHGAEQSPSQTPAAAGHLKYPLNPLTFTAPPSRPNILIILLDSWRTDSFNAETMPLLHRRAAGAVIFDNHFSGGNATRCGVFSLFYGIPATYWHSFLAANQAPVLMDSAARHGYEFAIYASADLTSPEFYRTAFVRVPGLRISSKGGNTLERDADAQTGFLNFLATRRKDVPFFGFMFYDALHSFAAPPDGAKPFPTDLTTVNYFALTNSTDPLPIANLYKNSAHHVDLQLNKVFEALEREGLLDNTIVMVSGDHSQEINDSRTNSWGHNINFSKYETQTPLLIFWPGKPAARYSHRTTHLDVAPTLMKQVLGCDNPVADYATGRDLLDPAPRPHVIMASYAKTAIMTADDEVFVLDKYGMNQGWNLDYSKKAGKLPPKILKDALMEMRRFYE